MHDQNEEFNPPSRSQLRRDALAIFKLAEALVALKESELDRVPLSDELRDEVLHTRRITQQIARKRQTQFLAKQLRRREEELEPIRRALEHDRNDQRRETAELHRLEIWRERLIEEGDSALSELISQFPHADHHHLRQLARQAREDHLHNTPLSAARALFQELRRLFEKMAERKADE